jgi:hypothetical protein
LLAITMVALLGGAFVAYVNRMTGRRRRAPRRALLQIPATPIAGVKDGEMVRIAGRAVARGPLLTSPLSQRRCIGFRLTVDSSRGGNEPWQRVVDHEALDAFLLADETGEAVLHGPFEIELDPYDAGSDPPPALLALLEKEGLPVSGVYVDRQFRYIEIVLLPGDEITAFGRATVEIDAAGHAASHRHPPIMCHLKGRDEAVIIADADDLAP